MSDGSRNSRVFVDEVEDEIARLVWQEEVFAVPVHWLPQDVHEGDWLRIEIRLDGEGDPSRRTAGEKAEQRETGDVGNDAALPHEALPRAQEEHEAEHLRERLAKDDPGGDLKL